MIDILFAMPLWLLAIVLNVWLMGFALLGLWIERRHVLPRMRLKYDDAYFAAAVVQSAMLLYGLIAALTAVGVWQKYSQVSDTVSAEASAITSVWRDLGGYPQPLRDETRDVLRGYTEQIIRDAWPQQRLGQIPREGVAWMDRLQAKLFGFEPVTEVAKNYPRRDVALVQPIGAAATPAAGCRAGWAAGRVLVRAAPRSNGLYLSLSLFQVENGRFQAILLLGLAGFLAMVLFVIIALDRPFVGDTGITAESYQLIYDHHMKR